MGQRFITPEAIFARGVCDEPAALMSRQEIMALFDGRAQLSAAQALDLRLPWERRLWTVLHPMALSEVQLMACALAFARYALERHGDALPEPRLLREALAAYEAWLRDEAATADRDAAREAVVEGCRRWTQSLAGSPALAAVRAVVAAGRARSFEAARMAAYHARRAAANPVRGARDEVEIVRRVLADGDAARYRRDVAASEMGAGPAPAPLNNNYQCKMSMANQTSIVIEYHTNNPARGYIDINCDSIPANFGPVSTARGYGATCSEFGTSGSISYSLGNNQTLVLAWNVPFFWDNNTSPYFYALLQGPQAGQYQVEVSNLDNLDYCWPPPNDGPYPVWLITPLVTLSNSQ